MRKCRKQSEADQVTRKIQTVDYFSLLHDELLLDILKNLPADLLRYKVRFVCRRWFHLITNRILLDHASLIIEHPHGCRTVRLMDITEESEGLKMKEQLLKIPYGGRIKSWFNELLLMTDLNRQGSLYIFNLISKEGSWLPPCSTSCGGHYGCKCGVGLSYDEFKGVYKVIHVFMGPPIQCELVVFKSNNLSFNFSNWKKINGPSYMGQRKYYWEDPVSVQGRYFHWDVHCSKYLVSMDTVKERFRQTCLPGSIRHNQYSFIEMGGFLTLLQNVFLDLVHIWILKDLQRTKWEKLQSIRVSSYVCSSIYPSNVLPLPVTSVKSKRFLIFRKLGPDNGLYSYDRIKKVMKRLDIKIGRDERCVVQSTAASY